MTVTVTVRREAQHSQSPLRGGGGGAAMDKEVCADSLQFS